MNDDKEFNPAKPAMDIMRSLCIEQGYVPAGCTLRGEIVFMLVNRGEDPCAGCNEDRAKCGGRPRR